ncbi:hypothetical protein PENSUB_3228 [Penicillium subrubescens]|uniref:HORMA domain-containing protein n=1 Tax=Penicillium subrubescens TaxID=1316194 RepID=A0A1Q5UFF6_9EURO|nr:hypothetical protein PENSUB_3228 [Penicillium subrubescens]
MPSPPLNPINPSNPPKPPKPPKTSFKMSSAKHKPQPLKRASIDDVDVDELSALERIKEKKRKLEEDIESLVEKKRRKLDEVTVQSRKGRPEGGLLPQTSFGIRALPVCFADESFCFEEHFMNEGIIPVDRYPVQLRAGEIMVMERGKDRLTNSIISCLETIFAKFLLQRKLLGLQFVVCKGKNNRTEVYERYTISIHYSGKRGPSDREGKKLDFHDTKKDLKYSMKVQKGIIAMFRRMFMEISNSTLPNTRTLAVHVFHTPLAPNPMNGDSFNRFWTEHLSFPRIPGWQRQTIHSDFIDTGFYGTINGVPEPMPAQLNFSNHRNRGADVHWEHGLDWVKKEIAKRAAAKKAAREKALKQAKKA